MKLGVSLFLVSLGFFLGYKFHQASAAILIIAIILMLTGLHFFWDLIREWRNGHPLSVRLRNNPTDIVWVYSIVTMNMPFGIHLMNRARLDFKCRDGQEFHISIPQKEIREISKKLEVLLPHATFGYTQEKMQWFITDPHLLYNDKEKEAEK